MLRLAFSDMGNKHNFFASVSLLALGGTAHADDMSAPEVPGLTGFYVGAGGGVDYLSSSLLIYGNDIFNQAASDASVASGFGTFELGADYRFDSDFLIGAVGNFDFGAGTNLGSLGSLPTMGTPIAEWEAGNSWGIGARAGYLVSPRTLIYGIGGFTQLDVRTDLFAGGNASTSDDEWTSGYFVGAGVETLLTDNLSLKLEYRFSRYDQVSATATGNWCPSGVICPPPMPLPNTPPCEAWRECNAFADIDDQTVRVTLAWRFNR